MAFLDDDAFADSEWLAQIKYSFLEIKPEISACGGKVELVWEIYRPDWINDSMAGYLGEFNLGTLAFFTETQDQNPIGLNMAFNKKIFIENGNFNSDLGRKGGTLLSNEETQVFEVLRQKNLKIYYNPKMLAYHHVNKERTKKDFFYKRYYWQGRSDAIMSKEEIKLKTIRVYFCNFGFNLISLVKTYVFSIFSKKDKEQELVIIRCNIEYYWGFLYQTFCLR